MRDRLQEPGALLVFPEPCENEEAAFARTTHLAIGAHADDLEIMAYHGIAQCYEESEQWFSGITVTNGVGSPQGQSTILRSHEELRQTRQAEQVRAASLGKYSVMAQLDYGSAEIRTEKREQLVEELAHLIALMRPACLYLHQPADKHPTHLAVLQASIEALRRLPDEDWPSALWGCEVWRDLDWLADEEKVYLPTEAHPTLAQALLEVFESQIQAGVAYDRGTLGRRAANATFADPHVVIAGDSYTLAFDLLPVLQEGLTLQEFITPHLEAFQISVQKALSL